MSADLRTIATFSDPIEAELVANRLDDEGIAATVSGDVMSSTFSGMGYMAGGIDILVPAAELDRARDILANFAKEVEARKHRPPHAITAEPPVPEMEESAEGEPVDDSGGRLIERAFRAALFGFFLLPPLFHFYSFMLVLKALQRPKSTWAGKEAKFYAALLIDTVIVVPVLLLMAAFAGFVVRELLGLSAD